MNNTPDRDLENFSDESPGGPLYSEGKEAGRAWAQRTDPTELERVCQLVRHIEAGPGDISTNDPRFWPNALGEDSGKEHDPNFLEGFFQGALEVWHEFKGD